MTILKTHGLCKVYEGSVPFTALKNISMSVDEGDFVAIMGPSGSGKSTFLNVISTIDKPTAGSVFIRDANPFDMNDDKLAAFRRDSLGFIFQDFNLVNTLTVEENIMLPMTFAGISVAQMRVRTQKTAEFLGISALLKKRTYEISGGQAQRVAIARAVIRNPALLLADEPTGNLDSKAARSVMELFALLNEQNKATILMVTHDSLVASYAKRVLIIKDGQIFQQINRGETRLAFQQRIVDAMNMLGGDERDVV